MKIVELLVIVFITRWVVAEYNHTYSDSLPPLDHTLLQHTTATSSDDFTYIPPESATSSYATYISSGDTTTHSDHTVAPPDDTSATPDFRTTGSEYTSSIPPDLTTSNSDETSTVPEPTSTPGPIFDGPDFTIAGLFTIHSNTIGLQCDTIHPDHVILSEAHRYAIEMANKDVLSLRNLSMGGALEDTCGDRSTILQKTVSMIRDSKGLCIASENLEDLTEIDIAFVGSFDCDLAENINYLLQAFCVPIVSSLCTSAKMDENSAFPLFARTIASDAYRAQVMYDVILSQQFFHISILHDGSMVGTTLKAAFNNLIVSCGLEEGDDDDDGYSLFRPPCTEDTIELPFSLRGHPEEPRIKTQLESLNKTLLNNKGVRVFVVFMEPAAIDMLLTYLWGWGYRKGDIQFIFPTTEINTRIVNVTLSDVIQYAFAVDNAVDRVNGFKERLDSTTVSSTYNTYLRELIMIDNQCCLPDVFDCPFSIFCTGDEKLKNDRMDFVRRRALQRSRYVIDSVYLIAHTMKTLHEEYCEPDEKICMNITGRLTGKMFFDKMMETQFKSIESSHKFTTIKRSGMPKYNIFQRQNDSWVTVFKGYDPLDRDLEGQARKAGKENHVPLDIHNDIKNTFEDIINEAQTCQKSCDKGYPDFGKGCCWTCIACGKFSFLNETVEKCVDCPDTLVANQANNGCVEFYNPDVLFFKPSEEIEFMLGFAILGCILTIPTFIILIVKRDTPMVRAATPDLSFAQVMITLGLFVISGFMVPSPRAIVCATVWAFAAINLTACHSVFLLKSLRIAKPYFFLRLSETARTPVRASAILISVIILLQVFVVTIWLVLRMPTIVVDRVKDSHVCSSNNEIQTIVLLVIPLILLMASLFFQRRACAVMYLYQIHQARMGIAGSLCFIVNYAVLIPLIFVEESAEDVKAVILMCVPLLTGYVAWLTMLMPTTYELLAKPKQNAKEYVSRQRSRQFQEGNVMYFVESVVFNRPKGLTISTISNWK